MDTLDELELFAQCQIPTPRPENEPALETIKQYMDLFGISKQGAVDKVNELGLLLPTKRDPPKKACAATYLVKFEGLLSNPEAIQSITHLPGAP